jgi:hypothetical protein
MRKGVSIVIDGRHHRTRRLLVEPSSQLLTFSSYSMGDRIQHTARGQDATAVGGRGKSELPP